MKQQVFSVQDFAAIVSHDVRAPVRHVCQFATLLAESLDEPTEEQKQYLEFIENSTERFNHMMDALMELCRLDAQPSEAVAIDVEGLLRQACANVASHEPCRPTLTVANHAQQSPKMVVSHATTLIEALTENAFKFRREDRDLVLQWTISSNSQQLAIQLDDNGIGIPSHFLEHCTTIFKQLDKNVEGVGIGLTLVDKIVSLYGGWLAITSGADSSLGGTSVIVTLPLQT